MEIKGEHEFRGPRELLWELLLDPAVLASALPGVERFEEVAPDTYESTMRVGIASVRGTYTGRVEVLERTPPELGGDVAERGMVRASSSPRRGASRSCATAPR